MPRMTILRRVSAVAIAACLCFPYAARASVSIASPAQAFYYGAKGSEVARLDIAYDEINRVYLAVWCTFGAVCRGQFLDLQARAIGSGFEISGRAGFARVAWGGDGAFIIAYTPTLSLQRYVRFLRYKAGGTAEYLTDPILLGVLGDASESESDRATMVYVPSAKHYLVTWWEWYKAGLAQTYVKAFKSDGTMTVGRTQVSDGTDGQTNPDMTCDFKNGRCLVVGYGWGAAYGFTGAPWGQFIDATTGQRIGNGLLLSAGVMSEGQQVDYSPVSGTFVTAWVQSRAAIVGRTVSEGMAVGGSPYTMLTGGYGQISLRYNRGTDSFLLTAKDSGMPAVSWMLEVDNRGAPVGGSLTPASTQRSTGEMNPTLAANPEYKQFGLVHSQDYVNGLAGVIQVGAGTGGDTGGSPACSYSVAPTSLVLGSTAGTGSVTVTTDSTCKWSATTGGGWVALGDLAGAGKTTIQFGYAANPKRTPRSGSITVGGSTLTLIQAAAPEYLADFDGDGQGDIIWQNRADGRLATWRMEGVTRTSDMPLGPGAVGDPNWKIVGTPDLNRDGYPDLLWQHDGGLLAAWFMRGDTQLGGDFITPAAVADPRWRVAATADLDRDGSADIIWQHERGTVAVWYMNGTVLRSGVLLAQLADSRWRLSASADFNGDSYPDLIWRNVGTGQVAIWYMRDRQLMSGEPFDAVVSDTNWQIVGVGDFDTNTRPDLLWRNAATGALGAWMLNGTTILKVAPLNPGSVPDLNWMISGPR